MRNKGFTLIELLAVIVILAIIALIATPIVLGIINESRESADKETAKLIASHIETAYSVAYMSGAKAGSVPTIDDVITKFNMDNVTKPDAANTDGEYVFTSTSGVNCYLKAAPGTGTESSKQYLSVECYIGDKADNKKVDEAAFSGENAKMEISTDSTTTDSTQQSGTGN